MSNKNITSPVNHTVTFGSGAYAGYSSLTVDAVVQPSYTTGMPATYGLNGVYSSLKGRALQTIATSMAVSAMGSSRNTAMRAQMAITASPSRHTAP